MAGKIVPGQVARIDTHAMPTEAAREALANARDYACAPSAVAVALYNHQQRGCTQRIQAEAEKNNPRCDKVGAMTAPKTTLITGISVQDGAYPAEFLLDKGRIVDRIKRRAALLNTGWIEYLYAARRSRVDVCSGPAGVIRNFKQKEFDRANTR